jgi:glycosyltransferase involved in cell wall biosynthesis
MVDPDHDALRLSSRPDPPEPAIGFGEPSVAILLSTYNGEPYLADQLRSFTAQTHGNWQLYWRDDGSSDHSPVMMAAFGKGPGWGRCVHIPEDGKLRATGSFLALLDMALRSDAAFFAFSDQDDVWLPEKLAHAVAALDQVTAGRPALYFCPRTPVDRRLRPIGQSPALRRPPGFPAALTQNVIPGCCMTLNRAAAELINAAEAPDRTWHDWWCYLVVSARDGLVIGGETPDILYRQHDRNLVGEPRRFWRRSAAAVRRGRDPFLDLFWQHVAALQAYPGLLPDRTRQMLATIVVASRGGLLARARALFIPGLVRQTWWETLLFRLWFLLG